MAEETPQVGKGEPTRHREKLQSRMQFTQAPPWTEQTKANCRFGQQPTNHERNVIGRRSALGYIQFWALKPPPQCMTPQVRLNVDSNSRSLFCIEVHTKREKPAMWLQCPVRVWDMPTTDVKPARLRVKTKTLIQEGCPQLCRPLAATAGRARCVGLSGEKEVAGSGRWCHPEETATQQRQKQQKTAQNK